RARQVQRPRMPQRPVPRRGLPQALGELLLLPAQVPHAAAQLLLLGLVGGPEVLQLRLSAVVGGVRELALALQLGRHRAGEDEVAFGQQDEQRPGPGALERAEGIFFLPELDEDLDVVAVVIGVAGLEEAAVLLRAAEFLLLRLQRIDRPPEVALRLLEMAGP